jgi:hypothetical protein
MKLMAAAKKAVKRAAKKVAKVMQKPAKGSAEWFAAKEEARKNLDSKPR